ncbi:PAS domain S-box protein [Pseudanabaena sp. FACHB-2040]|uniref:PAS domain-containing hybrid sensor histidine kinase/response regulator n=1 Tax=Pseudanabaena sp. FACHB-2040 TaxID=2692859 RepID=UPI00168735DA|nr:PAS domain S-box protein [Pseudanabaena sp. FACHB-2040]MBD2258243.1 PAS domain S-box protein [Pseudanabaena sp. FACHB-2040]
MPSEETARSQGHPEIASLAVVQVQDRSEAISEEAFFFARSLDLLSVIGLDGYFKRINPMFTQTLGYCEAEFLASPFLDFVHLDDHPATLAEMEKLNRGAPTLAFENRYRTKDGCYRWLAWTASPQVDQGMIYCVARDITQQKQTEAALRESEERWQLALRGSNDGIWDWNVQTDEVFFSTRWKTMLGYKAHEIDNHFDEWKKRVHPDDLISVTQSIQNHFAQKTPFYINEHRVLCKDGTYKWILDRGQAIWDEAGKVLRIVGSHTDVTERRELEAALQRVNQDLEQRVAERTAQLEQANAALQESREILQRQLAEIETLYQSAPIGLNVLDTDLRFVRINQRLAEMNGISAETHIGRTVRELLPEMADAAEHILRPILETGEPRLNVEIVGETPAHPGVQRVWLESFLPLKDGERVIGISTVCEEITERKRVEAALRQSEERYRTLFETMEDGFCVIEVLFDENTTPIDYRFLESNPAFERQSGLYQAVGKTARQLVPTLEEFWFETYGKVALTGEPVRFENGSDVMNRWFEVYAFPIEQLENHKVAVLFKDISDRKAIETQREKLLQQEQAAREAAERANRMKDEFLAVLSHELRTPLNPILGWAKLLQSPQVSSIRLQQGLTTIESNAKQQVQLIDDLLDISRIIRGKITLNFASVALSRPITEALETVRLAAEAKAIELEVFLEPSVGQVRGDASRLQQVIWNLLSNAIKFTPAGGRVRLQLTQCDRNVQIQVSDTGKGIQPTFLPHVFELFQQQDSSTTRSFGGLGLGLAIARQVVEAHGGTITAASAGEGQGAIFTVQLPSMPTLNVYKPDFFNHQPLNLENLRVMVVDDESDSLELLKVLLEQEGAAVTAVSSAARALHTLTQDQFDLLISDIGMTEMDGYALIRQVRTLPAQHNRSIPAVALTAYAGETNQQRALEAGFQVHLAKPVEPQQLMARIAALVKP